MTSAMATAYVDETLRLRREAGLDDALIARATGAARSTVRDWFARRSAPDGAAGPSGWGSCRRSSTASRA